MNQTLVEVYNKQQTYFAMKLQSTFLILLLSFSALGQTEKPEPILGFAIELKPTEWYLKQQQLWKQVLDKDKSNAAAWYNYYRVSRNLSRINPDEKRSKGAIDTALTEIVNEMEKHVSKSYEFNLCKWLIGGNSLENKKYLLKAIELGEGKAEHLPDAVILYEQERNLVKKAAFLQKWLDLGAYSPGLMYYNYNVLISLEPNAILISNGDNDTYPIWLLQQRGIRKDVTLLNSSLLYLDDYRNKMFAELGLKPFEPFKKPFPITMEEYQAGEKRMRTEMLDILSQNKYKSPVYIAVTCGDLYAKENQDNFYLTGLTYQYSKTNIDNIALLRKNFELNYALDYLDKEFYFDLSSYYAKESNMNYIIPMVKLWEHYKLCGEKSKADKIKLQILSIVKGREEEKETADYLNQ